jgi:hypothetical protein
MRMSFAVIMMAGVAGTPSIVLAQDVIIRQPAERGVIVREPSERVIVREPEERVIVHRAPQTVRRYVIEERRPSVAFGRRVVVGDTLPETLETYDVPDSDYSYVVLNERRYIVDGDRRIVDIAD